MFSTDSYFGKYELLIRERVGLQLDDYKKLIAVVEDKMCFREIDWGSEQTDKEYVTGAGLLEFDEEVRCSVLSTLLYNDALWKLESSHIVLCIGLVNVAYSNLRTSLEALSAAFIVERCDNEAQNFLKNKKVNLKKLEELINSDFNYLIKDTKILYSKLGVHPYIEGLRFNALFGPDRFEKYLIEVAKVECTPQITDGLVNEILKCINHGRKVGMLFSYLTNLPANDSVI